MTILEGYKLRLSVKNWAIPLLLILNIPYLLTGRLSCFPAWAFDVEVKDPSLPPLYSSENLLKMSKEIDEFNRNTGNVLFNKADEDGH